MYCKMKQEVTSHREGEGMGQCHQMSHGGWGESKI